jgi:hypothetical protein
MTAENHGDVTTLSGADAAWTRWLAGDRPQPALVLRGAAQAVTRIPAVGSAPDRAAVGDRVDCPEMDYRRPRANRRLSSQDHGVG